MVGTDAGKSNEGKKSNTNMNQEQIAPSSPLYLHPSESPSLTLTQTIFNGENYGLWEDAVRNGLDPKNKLRFVEGVVKKPHTNEGEVESLEAVAWRQCNAMVKAWLRNVIEPRRHPSISFTGTVTEIWNELKKRYSAGNAPRVHQLKSELNDCKQGNNQSIVDYYTKMKATWDELANYSHVPQCTCGAAAALAKEREEEKVHQFLMGLDTQLYGHIRTNLLMEDDITSLSRAYALVLREERHRAVTSVKDEINDEAMTARTVNGEDKGRGDSSNNEAREAAEPRCTFCKKFYHTEDTCWEKYPELFPGRGRGRGRRGGRGYGRGGRGQGNTFQVAHAASTSEGEKAFTSEEMTQL
ncbi:uncharacterized protein LOC141649752 [Silene latifolia]|uniref:uncharacterized protein LOC141649752 n=1 Tax=Silene latifolia TaxID=37657 RepID=UPI003D77F989